MLRHFKRWRADESAVIAIEVGILMPVMLTLLMGVVDAGNAVLTSQKVINAAQTVGDLLGRDPTIASSDLTDCITAGQLALMPYSTTSFGIDVVGVQFQGGPTQPKIMWRYTNNMPPNANVLTNAVGLGNDQDGVLGVSVQYIYTPLFSGVFTGPKTLYEVSYVRGRNGLFIPFTG